MLLCDKPSIDGQQLLRKNVNICFIARPFFHKLSVAIYKYIRDNIDDKLGAFFITTNKKETNYIKSKLPRAICFETSTYLRKHWDSFSKEKLIEIEKKYDCSPIWKYIYTDRFLINMDYDDVIHIVCGLFCFFEEVFTQNNIDFYYSEAIATFQCYAAYLVGKKTNTKYISQMLARGFDKTHHYFLIDEFQSNLNFNKNYKSVKYSDEEYKRADVYLSDFESKDIRPAYMALTGKRPRFEATFLLRIVLRSLRIFNKKYNDPCSYMYYKAHKHTTDPLKFYFRYLRSRKYYNKADYNQKFVYFPLHYQPEASTLVCATKYEKQLFFIDSWAKSIPADTMLYVKEHYAVLGHRELSFYKELKKYPNVVLIDPWESSRKLIENSVAVTTLTGTAGFEAMLLRKPVFLGGNIFFENAPGIIKINDIFDNYMTNIKEWKQPSREDVVQYLCEYMRTLHVGYVNFSDPKYLNEENIKNISEALYNQIMSLFSKRS